jgi:phospholipase D1/2
VTATGDQQAPVQNTIGRAIVDAVVRAGKEGRKFKVIIVIPSIPGFAGDLRQSAAAGTRAIMDYQYKSILRGEHSIFGQIRAQGVDPTGINMSPQFLIGFFYLPKSITEHIFFFNLRSYDRINKTSRLVEQEEKSGVRYQDVQRANAEQIMSESVHPGIGEEGDAKEKNYSVTSKHMEQEIDNMRKFEEQREQTYGEDREIKSKDNIAQNAMLNHPKVSEELWGENDPETEKENFIQEELYVHGKVCIADDRIVICGSANINDRVSATHCY